MGQTPKDYLDNAIFVFSPEVAYAWTLLYKDATKWRMPSPQVAPQTSPKAG